MGLAGAAVLYKSTDDFFLSTSTLLDGKGGFTSNARLDKAYAQAKTYYREYHLTGADAGGDRNPMPRIRTCGSNEFATMTDYRAATKVHLEALADHPQARQSLIKHFDCLKGHLVKAASVDRYQPRHVPENADLTKSQAYATKGKYALVGVPNEETGATGYASRSITQPFVNKGFKHYQAATQAQGLSLRQCMDSLERLLQHEGEAGPEKGGLGAKTQLAAGQALLNFRQVYAHEEHWGHAENVIMQLLKEQGLLQSSETEKLDASLMFESPSKNILKRNTGVLGPLLHQFETAMHKWRLRDDPQALADLLPMAQSKNIENLAIAHFKLNEQGNGFEDCSGLGDSFTCANAVACINHARLMSEEPRLSKDELVALVACFNAVYDDASGSRHTLHEIARGCFAGAGYTIEEADDFYKSVCQNAAQAFYGGKQRVAVSKP